MLEIAHQLKRIADLLHTEVNEIKLYCIYKRHH